MKFKGMDLNQEQMKWYCLFESLYCSSQTQPPGAYNPPLKRSRFCPWQHFLCWQSSVPNSPGLQTIRHVTKTLGDDEKMHLGVPSSVPHFHFLARNTSACFVFMFRRIFEQLLKGAESLWQAILISYSLYKHAAIKPFQSVQKTAICRAQHEHSIKVGSNTRLRETTAGGNTQEAWASAWATGKAERRWLLQRQLAQKRQA